MINYNAHNKRNAYVASRIIISKINHYGDVSRTRHWKGSRYIESTRVSQSSYQSVRPSRSAPCKALLTYNGRFSSLLAIFTGFFVGLWKCFKRKSPSLLAISKHGDYLGAIYKTNVNKCYIFFEEIIACLTRGWARLLSIIVSIIVASSDGCQTMQCKMNGKILKFQDWYCM